MDIFFGFICADLLEATFKFDMQSVKILNGPPDRVNMVISWSATV